MRKIARKCKSLHTICCNSNSATQDFSTFFFGSSRSLQYLRPRLSTGVDDNAMTSINPIFFIKKTPCPATAENCAGRRSSSQSGYTSNSRLYGATQNVCNSNSTEASCRTSAVQPGPPGCDWIVDPHWECKAQAFILYQPRVQHAQNFGIRFQVSSSFRWGGKRTAKASFRLKRQALHLLRGGGRLTMSLPRLPSATR